MEKVEKNQQTLTAEAIKPEAEKTVREEEKNNSFNKEFRRGKRDDKRLPRSHLKIEKLATGRPVKVTKGGRRFSFTSLVLVKDEEKKAVAFAYSSGSKEAMEAFYKSIRKAQKKLITYFPIPVHTIPRNEEVKYKSVTIKLWPAPLGTGVKAGSVLNKLFKFLEIKDISAKIIASRRARKNKLNVIRTAFLALDKLTGKKYKY